MEAPSPSPSPPQSLIDKINNNNTALHFASPLPSSRTNEFDLVRGVLHLLQGFSTSFFYWDPILHSYRPTHALYLTHLSHTSLHTLLHHFLYSATCLKLVDTTLCNIYDTSPPPTLTAFARSVSAWLAQKLRDIALKQEVNMTRTAPTILGLASSLTSLCSGAEYLLQIVNGAIPKDYIEGDTPVSSAEMAVHILNHLYEKLNDACLVQGGEEDSYRMLLYIFVGCLFPYIEVLDSWIFEGILDDPSEEMFFYANKAIAIDEAEFWEKSYLLRSTQHKKPGMAHVTQKKISLSSKTKGQNERDLMVCPLFFKDIAKEIISAGKSLQLIQHVPITSSSTLIGRHHDTKQCMNQLSLSEIFCLSLTALIGHGDHMSQFFWQNDKIVSATESCVGTSYSEKIWYKFLVDRLPAKRECVDMKGENAISFEPLVSSFCPENPTITVCQKLLQANTGEWNSLNLSNNYILPPLDDEELRKAIFDGTASKGTNYASGFPFGDSENVHSRHGIKAVESLFPFPTVLPSFKVDNIGSQILSKLLRDWKLMDELGVLRDVYLLGSGDLLQHFLAVVFTKLDKGESWDDDFELNTVLQ
ncbi:hypothetical protein M8C21_033805, partial [Ambrosia artemisiifolia]